MCRGGGGIDEKWRCREKLISLVAGMRGGLLPANAPRPRRLQRHRGENTRSGVIF